MADEPDGSPSPQPPEHPAAPPSGPTVRHVPVQPGWTAPPTLNTVLVKADINLPSAPPINYPPVEVIETLERLAPGSAAKIADSYVEEGRERRRLHYYIIQSDVWTVRLRLILGALLVVLLTVLSHQLISAGHVIAGTLFAGADLGVVILAIVTGRGKSEGGGLEQVARGVERLGEGDASGRSSGDAGKE